MASASLSSLEGLFKDYDASFVISNPREPDNPIVYASAQFFQTTGYAPAEILGRNCRFLQGAHVARPLKRNVLGGSLRTILLH